MIYGLSNSIFTRILSRSFTTTSKGLSLKVFSPSEIQANQSQQIPLGNSIDFNKHQEEKIYRRLLVNRVKEIQHTPVETWTDEDLRIIELAERKFKDVIIGSKKYKSIKEEIARRMEEAAK
jgi:hypothetical protein